MNHCRSRLLLAPVVFSCLFLPVAGFSITTSYIDRADWADAAEGQEIVEDFNAVSPGGLAGNSTNEIGKLTVVYIDPPSAGGFVEIDNGTHQLNFDGSVFLRPLLDGGPKAEMILVFPTEVMAWGAEFMTPSSGDPPGVSFGEITNIVDIETIIPGPRGEDSFVGWVSDVPFDRVVLRDPYISFSHFGLDDVTWAVPPLRITGFGIDSEADYSITWPGTTGVAYRVECSTNMLESGSWQEIGTVVASTSPTVFTNVSGTEAGAHYRVAELDTADISVEKLESADPAQVDGSLVYTQDLRKSYEQLRAPSRQSSLDASCFGQTAGNFVYFTRT